MAFDESGKYYDERGMSAQAQAHAQAERDRVSFPQLAKAAVLHSLICPREWRLPCCHAAYPELLVVGSDDLMQSGSQKGVSWRSESRKQSVRSSVKQKRIHDANNANESDDEAGAGAGAAAAAATAAAAAAARRKILSPFAKAQEVSNTLALQLVTRAWHAGQ